MAARRRNARRQPRSFTQRVASFRGQALLALRYLLTLGALLLIVAVGSRAVSALKLMPVERIVVSGKLEHLRQEAVRDALAGRISQGLLFLDLRELQGQLEELPWVYRAELRRRFPGTLEVRVVEQLPIARWGDTAFLNHEAVVIPVADASRWDGLPTIRGPEGSEGRLMNRYRRLRDSLAAVGLTPQSLVEDEFGQLQVHIDNGMALLLGDREFSRRTQRFLKLWQVELNAVAQPIRHVDLRYNDGAAVAFDPPAQELALGLETEIR